jgi:hypothetical protein
MEDAGMKPFVIIVATVAAMAAVWWAIEMGLLKASRYRLAHGDGREHSFRRKDRGASAN